MRALLANHVVACPHCQAESRTFPHALQPRLLDATFWSDGKVGSLANWEVTRCPHCALYIWLRDAAQLDKKPASGSPEIPRLSASELLEALASGTARTPDEERRLRLLAWWRMNDPRREPAMGDSACGCCSLVMGLAAGLVLWQWVGGSGRWYELLTLFCLGASAMGVIYWLAGIARIWARAEQARGEHLDPEGPFQNNLRSLGDLLREEEPEERVKKAEVMRQLGRFSEAIRLLDAEVPGAFQPWARYVEALARGEDSKLQMVPVGRGAKED